MRGCVLFCDSPLLVLRPLICLVCDAPGCLLLLLRPLAASSGPDSISMNCCRSTLRFGERTATIKNVVKRYLFLPLSSNVSVLENAGLPRACRIALLCVLSLPIWDPGGASLALALVASPCD